MAARVLALLTLASILLAGCLGATDPAPASTDIVPNPLAGSGPLVVIAHIDTGVNPYHVDFRDNSSLAYAHPSTYLPGFPADTPALNLTLDAATYAEALQADAAVWAAVEPGRLYWIPGTKIVGAVTFGPDGDLPIVDEHGHGTMTASRSAGNLNSLAPEARLVTVEGLGAESLRWVADQGWIDIVTNSWLSFFPMPLSAVADDVGPAFAYASDRLLTLAASGNGAAYITGFAPTPTYVLSTAAPGVVLVGAHDNGRVTLWSGAPPHVLADGYGGPHATVDSLDEVSTSGIACCSSASSPYAAGGAGALVLEARRVLGHTNGTGLRDGVLAKAPEGHPLPAKGPLADGDLTLLELRMLLLRTATPRPTEGPHDGEAQWLAKGELPSNPTQPGGNPYCPGCWTTPVTWTTLPENVPAYPHAGYGAVDPTAVTLGQQVLGGEAAEPERPTEDAFFALDQTLRRPVWG